MVDLIQSAKVVAPVIADLQGLFLCDSPIHQRVALIFDALRLISGNAHIAHGLVLPFQPIDLPVDKMRFQLSRTPANPGVGPTVSVQRNAQPLSVFNAGLTLFLFFEHQPFKALWMAKPSQMQPTLRMQILVQLV